jgi:hypothetical protein
MPQMLYQQTFLSKGKQTHEQEHFLHVKFYGVGKGIWFLLNINDETILAHNRKAIDPLYFSSSNNLGLSSFADQKRIRLV